MKRILVPTDFSDSAKKALRVARELCPDAHITLLHVFDPSHLYAPYVDGVGPLALLEDTEQNLQQEALNGLQDEKQEGEDTELLVGHPAETILQKARDGKADFIFMGTHGRRGLSHLFFGSVAEQVVRHSLVPVMVVRAMPQD